MKKHTHLLVWERMGDYHRARCRALSAWVGQGHCISADFGADDELYQWSQTDEDPSHEVLVQKPVEQVGTWESFRAFRRLVIRRNITHVSIPGYGRPAYLLMLMWSRLSGRKVLMFAESWYPGWRVTDLIKGAVLRLLTHRCFVSGERARAHFVNRLRYPEARLQTGYSVVDNSHFARRAEATAELDENERPRELLCVARFAEEKNLGLLVKAFKQSSISNTWKLILVGGGPMKQELEELAGDSNIEIRPWLDYDKLPKLFQDSSCFILPSQFEPWGLVVNEAMAAGLPVLLSNKVGAKPDLLEEDVNGWSFDPDQESELTGLLDRLATTSVDRLREMGGQSQKMIRHYSLEGWASSLAQGRYCWRRMEAVGRMMTLPNGTQANG